jgi:hypothetical protein
LRVQLQMASMPLGLRAYPRIFDPPESHMMYGNQDYIPIGERSVVSAFTTSSKCGSFKAVARNRRRGCRHRVSHPPNNNSRHAVSIPLLSGSSPPLCHNRTSRFISYSSEFQAWDGLAPSPLTSALSARAKP